MTRRKRAGIYTRISRDEAGDGLGVARQQKDSQELATRKGWQVVEVYEDNDVSATKGKPRPAHSRLLQDIESGLIEAVVVWDLDRLYRSPRELEDFLDLARKHDIDLASVSGDIDVLTDQGVMVAGMKAQVGRYEAQQIRRRIMRKQEELREKGLPFSGGSRPYGFDKHRVNHIPDEVAVIRGMADSLLSGKSLREIVLDLNARGVDTVSQAIAKEKFKEEIEQRKRQPDEEFVPPARGRQWTVATVQQILTSPRMIGKLTHKGEVVGDAVWDPVFDTETWEQIQVAIAQRKAQALHVGTSKARHLLSGIATCGECGTRMQARYNKEPTKSRYLCVGCFGTGRNMRRLDHYLVECLFDFLDVVKTRDENSDPADDPMPEIAALRQRLRDAADDYAEGILSREQLQRISTRLEAKIQDLWQSLPSPGANSLLDWYFGTESREQAWTEWNQLALDQKRLIISTHLKHFKIHRAKRLNHGLDTTTIDVLWKAGT